ncbi:MAG: hypothetical protein EOP07_21175, partial [Proteobacteria bacterium]
STPAWQETLKKIIPSYGQKLDNNPSLQNRVRKESCEALQLTYHTVAE